jgi:O-antigen ligase
VAVGRRGAKKSWRESLLWLSSPAATRATMSAVAIVAMAIAVVMSASRSGTAGVLLIAALLGGWIVRRQPSRGRRVVAIGYLVVLLMMAASWGRIETVLERFESVGENMRPAIWADTIRILRDAPWTGTGLNTYGIAMLHYQTVDDGFQYVEAHNDYLQLAAEGGLLLGIPILVTIGLFIREVRRRFKEGLDDTETYWIRVGAVIGLVAIAAQESVEFTLQMPGAAVLFVVLAAIAVHRPDHLRDRSPMPASRPRSAPLAVSRSRSSIWTIAC